MTPDHREAPIGPLTHPCDLDLLLYFHRYPRVLLTSKHLAAYTGYDVKQVGRSLETLIGAGVLTRSQNPTHEARLYVLATDSRAGWLAPVLAAASTPAGRVTLLRVLGDGAGPTPGPGGGRSARDDTEVHHA